MKIEATKDRLATAIQKAEKLTSKNPSLPVLKCVLLEAVDNSLIVRSTNLDIGLEISIPVKVNEKGSIAVPGNVLSGFISQSGSEKSITLEKNNDNLSVKTSKSGVVIKAFQTDEYPSIPKVDENTSKTLKIASKDLVNGLKSVYYSSATSNIKPELSSVRVYPLDGNLVFVATDGFRLAEKKIFVKNVPEFTHILIPAKNVNEIIRIFDDLDEDLEVLLDDNQIAVKSDNIYMVSRTIEGNFPDYKAIIPKEFMTNMDILKQDFVNALKINTIFSDSFNHIKFNVIPNEKKIELSTRNSEIGESSVQLAGKSFGEPLSVNFNYRYINDSLPSLLSDSIEFSFSGTNKPLVIKAVGDTSFTYLVMPMNR